MAALSRACGIFVLYLTACCNDVAKDSRRTTISASDVMGALKVGFDIIVVPRMVVV